MILDWQENLASKDIPPQWMWHLDYEIKDWFEELEAKRGGGGDRTEADEKVAPMMRNALVRK